MKIEERQIGGVSVLKPDGPLVKADADRLRDYLVSAQVQSPGRVVVDTSAVAFVDSRGLEALVDTTEEMARTGRPLRLAGANETIHEAMDLTDVSKLFEFFDNVSLALESFA